jgi:REP element-mobilizing transposase RayT
MTNQPRSFVGQQFWAGGYFVSTVDVNKKKSRPYVGNPGLDEPV